MRILLFLFLSLVFSFSYALESNIVVSYQNNSVSIDISKANWQSKYIGAEIRRCASDSLESCTSYKSLNDSKTFAKPNPTRKL